MKPGVKAHMGEGGAWPEIRDTILGRDILILSTPIWLGHPSSSAQRVLERLNAELSETDDEGRMLPEQAKARNAIKDCDHRLARYQAALDAGADPAVVSQWSNEAPRDKESAQKQLDTLLHTSRQKKPPLNAHRIRQITEGLGDIAQRIHAASADAKGPLYEALGIAITYEHETRAATVRSRPSNPYRQWLCPRGDLNPHAR
ncbi:NADPH-dependent oxidoreductase [Streptomyces wuyuanensis]|uniref:NADPH-dependent oxidoreductase n=1 Tax=Streptomyces wuyuanensis TaxID=1196353 RepID=UPI00384D770D